MKTDRTTHLRWLHVDLAEGGRTYDRVEEAFAHHSRRLLILGEPGAGKSTSALQLALLLLEEAEKNPLAPVPLIVNLSAYRPRRVTPGLLGRLFGRGSSDPEQPAAIADSDMERWLAEQMRPYGSIPVEEARRWLAAGRVAVFFDGLDEVQQEFRAQLVELLNTTYLAKHTESVVVVCSRVDEYRALQDSVSTRLSLRGGVTLRPLDEAKVRSYLREAGAEALADRLLGDELQELTRNPLTLSMLALAYKGLPPESLPTGGTLSDRRRLLMDAFVKRMLQWKARRKHRRLFVEGGTDDVPDEEYQYPQAKVNRYLGWLAVQLSVRMRTTFPPDRCYPLVAEKPSAREGLGRGAAAAVGVWAGWLALGFAIAAAGTFPLIPATTEGILLCGALFLGLATIGSLMPFVSGWVENDELPYILVALPIVLLGVGLLGHTTAAILPWAWSPYPCTLIAVSLVVGVVGVIALVVGSDERLEAGVVAVTVSLVIPVSFGLATIEGWPLNLDWTWAGCLVGTLVIVCFWVGWRSASSEDGRWLDLGDGLSISLTVENETPTANGPSWRNFFRGIAYGAIVVAVAFVCLAAAWLVDPRAWHLAVGAFALTVFLFTGRREPELFAVPLCLAMAAALGGCAGGVAGFTLGVWCGLCLIVLLWAIGNRLGGSDEAKIPGLTWLFLIAEWFCLDPAVRVALAVSGQRPLRWRRFREYVQDAHLIMWAGSDQEFVHRVVRDYFATRELVTALANDERRCETLVRLGFQGESAIDILAEYLGHPAPDTQKAAVEGLIRIQSPRVLDFLKQAVHSRDAAVRRGVVVASSFRDEDDWRTVSQGLMGEEDVSVILAWAERILARKGGGTRTQLSVTGEVVVEKLCEQGGWRDELLFRFLTVTRCDRRLVVAALAYAARAGFGLDFTSKHHGMYGKWIRVDTLAVLVGRGWDRFWPLGEILPEGWVTEWLAHVHPAVRLGAVVVASATGRLAVAHAGELLRRDPEAAVRANAALALGEFHADRSSSDPGIGLEEVQSYLLAGTRDSDPRVRAAAAYAAASLPDAGRRVPLEEALRDPHPDVRSAAVCGLAVKWTFISEALLRGALEDRDPAVRGSVVEALLGLATLRVPHLPESPAPDEMALADDPECLHWAERAIAGLRRD